MRKKIAKIFFILLFFLLNANDAFAVLCLQEIVLNEDSQAEINLSLGEASRGLFSGTASTFTYQPEADFNGQDSVSILINGLEAGLICLNVNPVNDSPELNLIGDKLAEENQPLVFIIQGSDIDGDALTYSAQGLPTGAVFDSSGVFSWTPSYSQSGAHEITFVVSDGKVSDSEKITIIVTDASAVPTVADYIAFYQFDGNADNAAGTDNGVLMNGAVSVMDSGGKGQVLSLDGADDFAEISHSPAFNFGENSFSVSGWAKIDSNTKINPIFYKQEGGISSPNNKIIFYTNESGFARFGIKNGAEIILTTSKTRMNPNQWYDLAGIVNASDNTVKLYVDGIEEDSIFYDSSAFNMTNDHAVRIGKFGGYMLKGFVDDVMIFGRALSADEVKMAYDSQKPLISDPEEPIPAEAYFIDKNSIGGACSDSNAGTLAKPWCAIAKANVSLRAGDSVYIRKGVYNEVISPVNSGTAGNKIVYKAYPGEDVLIKGQIGVPGAVKITKNYIVVDGFRIKQNQPTNLLSSSAYTYPIDSRYSSHSEIINNKIECQGQPVWNGGFEAGIGLYSDYTLVSNNHIDGWCKIGILTGGSSLPNNNVISHNTIINILKSNIDFGSSKGKMHYAIIENNYLGKNIIEDGIQFESDYDLPAGTIDSDSNRGVVIRNNVIAESAENYIDLKAGAEILIEGNIFYGAQGNNNGGLKPGEGDVRYPGAHSIMHGSNTGSKDIIIRNNVIYDGPGGILPENGYKIYNNVLWF
ncbi:MAG: LamG-like jellyroll fold domain-containing protein, partial [bacterium]|nr:LamG-like jellyroll fold domain-containing protein [bacterium]